MARDSSGSPAPIQKRRPGVKVVLRQPPDLSREAAFIAEGARVVAGCDEAGRGPLAGPVVAAAVVLSPNGDWDGLNDSKVLKPEQRAAFCRKLFAEAAVGVGTASAAEIDRLNIRVASLTAMRRAIDALPLAPCRVIIDGRDVPPGLSVPGSALVSGDALSLSVAAASIVAKVIRDAMMRRAALRFPGYGFELHAGYATLAHREALTRLGACPIHRMSFSPLRTRDLFAEADESGEDLSCPVLEAAE